MNRAEGFGRLAFSSEQSGRFVNLQHREGRSKDFQLLLVVIEDVRLCRLRECQKVIPLHLRVLLDDAPKCHFADVLEKRPGKGHDPVHHGALAADEGAGHEPATPRTGNPPVVRTTKTDPKMNKIW